MKIRPPSFSLQIWLTFGGKTDLTIGIDIAAQISIVITALATVTSLFASFIGVLFSIGAIQFRSKHQWRKQVQTSRRSILVFFTDVRNFFNYNGLFSCQIQAWITGIVKSILRPSIKMRDDMVGGGWCQRLPKVFLLKCSPVKNTLAVIALSERVLMQSQLIRYRVWRSKNIAYVS